MLNLIAQMAGDNLQFANQTNLHPVGASVLAVSLLSMLLLPRKYAVVPLLLLLAVIPSAQRITVATLDFTLIRLLILGGLARVTLRSEWVGFRLRAADYLVLGWAVVGVVTFGIQLGTPSAAITRGGYMIDAAGGYFLGRALIRDLPALKQTIIWLAVVALPASAFFLVERATGRNLFSTFGGVPEVTFVRQGRLRCQGPFSHPIMAGVFWASLLPLFAALWTTSARSRVLLLAGGIASAVIILNTASSTPVMAVILGLGAFALYWTRSLVPYIRWSVLAAIPVLHVVMNNGVHHLLARINVVGGSTGWHRYHLMDKAMKHIDEWFLVGVPYTGHWGWGLQDVTNQYVLEGVRGGMLTLGLFSAWLVVSFVYVSRAIRSVGSSEQRIMLWACGSVLFAHALNFIAVSYFGQMTAAFFVFTGATVSLALNASSSEDPARSVQRTAVKRTTSFFQSLSGTELTGA